MTTRISQIDDRARRRAVLALEGALTLADAELLDRTCRNLQEKSDWAIVIDLKGLTFLTNEGATILCRLRAANGVALEGMHLFVQHLIETTEANRCNETEKLGEDCHS